MNSDQYSNRNFYDSYREYLQLPEVRRSHDGIFREWLENCDIQSVVDLGCGTCEFAEAARGSGVSYTGLDLQDEQIPDIVKNSPRHCFVKGDYRETINGVCGDAFVSLFATEIHLPFADRERFYERLFRSNGFRYGLVSGFIYNHRPQDASFHEVTTGFTVYQSVQPPAINDTFVEWRLVNPVPPGFFKEPFVEIWKAFRAK